MVLATAVFAAALLALPAIAHADPVKIADADLEDGVYNVPDVGDYQLDTDKCTGINVGEAGKVIPGDVTIDLNGKTISNSADHSCIGVVGTLSTKVTVSNGSLVQTNTSNAAVRVDSTGGSGPSVNLSNVNASSADHQCIDAENGRITIKDGGKFTATSDSSTASVLRSSSKGSFEVYAGTFTGSSITAGDSICFSLYGGTYSTFPEGTYTSSYGIICDDEGSFAVKTVNSIKEEAKYALSYTVSGASYSNPVYFTTESKANDFKAAHSSDCSDVQSAWLEVTFKADGATPSSQTQKVFYGTPAVKGEVEEPQSDDGLFEYWKDSDDNQYKFDTNLYEASTFTAAWTDYVAQVGDKKFTTLQAAVDAIEDGSAKASEIKLLKDLEANVTVNKGDFTLDLNGKTISAKDSEAAIAVNGPAKLTVKNGTISSKDEDSDGVFVTDAGADVTLEGLNIQDVDNAVVANAGKVTIGKGFVGKSETETLIASGSATVIIDDGTFSSADSNFLYIKDLEEQGSVDINGGEFSGMCSSNDVSTALVKFKINGGIFENWENVWAVADGKTFLEREDGRFEVVDAAKAKAQASWVVSTSTTFEGEKFKFTVYFRDETNARECYKKMDEEIEDGDATIKAIYHVEFVSQDKTVEVRGLEEGEAVGELPAGKEIAKYEFLGWYLNGNYSDDYKLSAETVIEHDVKAVALWKKVDTDEATSDPIEIEEADESSSSSSSSDSKSSPETGDAGVTALGFAALGSAALAIAARRRKAE